MYIYIYPIDLNCTYAGISRKPYPIIDCVGRVVAVLAGQPNNRDYAKVLMQAHDEMKDEGMKAGLGMLSPEGKHIRGAFPAYNCGTTMGMGSPRPVVMDPKGRRPLLTHLLNNEGVIRMARYQNCKGFPSRRIRLVILFHCFCSCVFPLGSACVCRICSRP